MNSLEPYIINKNYIINGTGKQSHLETFIIITVSIEASETSNSQINPSYCFLYHFAYKNYNFAVLGFFCNF